MAKARTLKVKWVEQDTSLPPLPQAAHLALLVMAAAGCNDWQSLVESEEVQQRVRVTPEQQQLLDDYDYVIHRLRRSPLRTLSYCPVCHRWRLVQKNPPAGQKCSLMIGCPGLMLRVFKNKARTPQVHNPSQLGGALV
ncbi:hypothetical protein ACXR2T_10185 [Leucobacter sp. HY1910]